ncbi:uncharacterized protein LOC109818134 [Cajanus cajan]|uniref:uncharacterized protein LOC109818134 n=1 Tax=Cajanus cajan TaxID=3821 RepID=UPI00098D9B51|nr:uncharacterized protein LOC109818134 [Cajanus cajan]
MQMLIDKDMSKQKDSKHQLPNVVAKLMGLETPPRGEPNLSVERSHRSDYSQHMYGPIGLPFKHWQQEDGFMDMEMLHEIHPSTEQVSYKDMYEIWQQSQRATYVRGKIPDRGKRNEEVDGKRMALIRQKFMEAKRMSTDERLRHTKQFKEALEVLSSNSDLLVRLLDSQNVYEFYSTPPNETKRVTLIKPLKMIDSVNDKSSSKEKKNSRLIKKPARVDQAAVWENKNPGNSPDSQKVDDSPVRTTRIVLLKPSPGRTHDQKAMISPTTSSPLNLKSGSFHQGPEYEDVLESIRVAKEITQQMHKGLRSYQKDKTPHSSVFSNGFSDDESSFNKSYHEYASAHFSDLEAMSPLPRLSWDYTNGCGSPYSTMSLGRVSCSPESSVCREAKKRLSERWTMMTSDNKGHQEQRQSTRSSTLGEMLSLTHKKKSVTSDVESINEDQEPGKYVSCSHSFNAEISIEGSPKTLPRSNSVPASSTVYEAVVDHNTGKAQGSKARTKSKSMRSSLKGKVASFLFSRSKKSTKKKPSPSQSTPTATETLVLPANSPEVLRDDVSQSINVDRFEECSLADLCESSGKTKTDLVSNRQEEEDMITLEPGFTVPRPMMSEINLNDNPDQPSPISVLQPPFEDYNSNASHESLNSTKSGQLGSQVLLKSNLIDKSPPIESIARTLSWDDSCAEVASPYPLKPLMVSSLDSKVEEHEWLLLVHKLLSAAGLDDQHQYDSFYTRWYSLESPLDPSLRDTYAKEPMPMHEGRRRKMRSNHKLVFDYVNSALLEIVGYGSEKSCLKSSGSHYRVLVQEGASTLLVDHIVAQMKKLIASGMKSEWEGGGDSNSLVVENVVRKEVVQIGWVELMELEIDVLGKEIEGELIQELVENVVVDFTGRD